MRHNQTFYYEGLRVNAAIETSGTAQKDGADELDVTPGAVSRALNETGPNR